MKIKNLFKPIIKLVMYCFRIFKIQENKIVFCAFSARTYGDNPRYIAEYINKISDKYDLVFILENPENYIIPKGIRTVKYNTIHYLYEMATAKYWIDNTRKQPHILKRKNQIYIQTWHGAISIKKIEKDAEKVLDSEYVKTAINDSKNINYLLTNSNWGEKIFKNNFWYSGPILKTGTPRSDILFNNNLNFLNKIKKDINLNFNTKVLLYAPTFRKDKNTDVYNIDYGILLNSLKNRFKGEWTILLKLHPNIKEKSITLPNYVKNVSDYPDINNLLLITDILITDYSSSIFDFLITKRPTFLYASDYLEYMNDRDTYFDLTALPFPFSETNEQLASFIKSFEYDKYQKNVEKFINELGFMEDGNACKRVFNIIENGGENENGQSKKGD